MKNVNRVQAFGLGLLAGAAFLSGCGTTVNTVERAQPVAQREMVSDKRILTNAALNRRVRIVGVNQSTGPGGLLKVQVELLNTTRSLQTFNYRWEWFDQTGTIIDTPTSTAASRQIEGQESIFITGVAPEETAKDFRLKLFEDLR
jgi:uncharacterized protein YcfL